MASFPHISDSRSSIVQVPILPKILHRGAFSRGHPFAEAICGYLADNYRTWPVRPQCSRRKTTPQDETRAKLFRESKVVLLVYMIEQACRPIGIYHEFRRYCRSPRALQKVACIDQESRQVDPVAPSRLRVALAPSAAQQRYRLGAAFSR